jgi:hypothetical protein
LAVSDNAYWFRAELLYDERGDLAGIDGAVMASMRDLAGNMLNGKEGDAEGLTAEVPGKPDGAVFVSFEGNARIWRYDLANGLTAKPDNVPIGEWVLSLPSNGGMEALTRLPSGDLLVLSEYGASQPGGFIGALEGSSSRILSVVERPPFRVTSAAFDTSSVFLLERRFSMMGGTGMGIRRIPLDTVAPGARLDGEIILDLSLQDANIDNMEGIAVRRGARGETLLYLISDDNGSALQRTLLLMFELQ